MKAIIVLTAILVIAGYAQDSLPWKGTIIFDDWVRVDDAPGISGHRADHPYTIIDTDYNIYVVWQDDRDGNGLYNIYFSYSSNLGATYSADICLSDSALNLNYRYPWLIKGRQTHDIYVVWQALAADNFWDVYLVRSSDGGATFSAPDTIRGITISNNQNSEVNFGPLPRVALSANDSILYLAWADGAGNSATRVKCARSTDGGNTFFGDVIVNTNLAGVARHPSIAVDDSDVVHIAYEQGSGTNQDPHPNIY